MLDLQQSKPHMPRLGAKAGESHPSSPYSLALFLPTHRKWSRIRDGSEACQKITVILK
jgi:hypothetical protein